MARGLAPSTATRALATLRSILAFAVADARVQHDVAASVRNPTSGRARREGQALTLGELGKLTEACKGRYRDVVPVLALAGLRWSELAGLQAGDRVNVPGPGLRLRRAVLAGGGGGALYVDTLKTTGHGRFGWSWTWCRSWTLEHEQGTRTPGCSTRRKVARCGSQTGSGQ